MVAPERVNFATMLSERWVYALVIESVFMKYQVGLDSSRRDSPLSKAFAGICICGKKQGRLFVPAHVHKILYDYFLPPTTVIT